MEHLGTLNLFVQAAEMGSFVEAGRHVGLSASAVGKAVARLEVHLGVRLFHRNTRSMTLTEEGRLYLDRCRRIFEEIEAAEIEITQTTKAPSGRLRVSLPLIGMLLMPVISEFMKTHPEIILDLDFTDRLVDVIEEGFDVVIRTGSSVDSRLMRKSLGRFKGFIVASPSYLKSRGTPKVPKDITKHDCLRQRSTINGKLLEWPWKDLSAHEKPTLSEVMSATTIEPLIHLAEKGLGITFLPPFAVNIQLKKGTLVSILGKHIQETGEMAVLWPTSRQLSPRIRAFVDFLSTNLKL